MPNKIFNKFKREKANSVSIEFERFTINEEPVCMAWYGLGSHDRMACYFLGVYHFGSKHTCLLTGEEIYPAENDVLYPTEKCPMWRTK